MATLVGSQQNLAPTTVAVAPTTTVVATFDLGAFAGQLTVQLDNLDLSQTFVGVVQRRLDSAHAWADSELADFSSIAAGSSICADLDTSGTRYLRLVGTMSGAGGDVLVSARRRSA